LRFESSYRSRASLRSAGGVDEHPASAAATAISAPVANRRGRTPSRSEYSFIEQPLPSFTPEDIASWYKCKPDAENQSNE
jgi:hypothetical protein